MKTYKELMLEVRKKQNKATWMKKYEALLKQRKDYKPGRIDWDSAVYFYTQGKSAEDAAKTVEEPFKSPGEKDLNE